MHIENKIMVGLLTAWGIYKWVQSDIGFFELLRDIRDGLLMIAWFICSIALLIAGLYCLGSAMTNVSIPVHIVTGGSQ